MTSHCIHTHPSSNQSTYPRSASVRPIPPHGADSSACPRAKTLECNAEVDHHPKLLGVATVAPLVSQHRRAAQHSILRFRWKYHDEGVGRRRTIELCLRPDYSDGSDECYFAPERFANIFMLVVDFTYPSLLSAGNVQLWHIGISMKQTGLSQPTIALVSRNCILLTNSLTHLCSFFRTHPAMHHRQHRTSPVRHSWATGCSWFLFSFFFFFVQNYTFMAVPSTGVSL